MEAQGLRRTVATGVRRRSGERDAGGCGLERPTQTAVKPSGLPGALPGPDYPVNASMHRRQ
jgi:hypothetical protein